METLPKQSQSATTATTGAPTRSVGTIEWDDDDRAPLRPLSKDPEPEPDDFPFLSREALREIVRATSRATSYRPYSWDETLGEGWFDRDDKYWDVRRPIAWSDTTDYSEAPSYRSSDESEEEPDDYYEPGI
jgi:hypothetical protein